MKTCLKRFDSLVVFYLKYFGIIYFIAKLIVVSLFLSH